MASILQSQNGLKIADTDIDTLIEALDVRFVSLSECLVSPGWRLVLRGLDSPALHYNIEGEGILATDRYGSIDLHPHTLVILPPKTTFSIEVPKPGQRERDLQVLDESNSSFSADVVQRYVAGRAAMKLVLICGYFQASYGSTTDIFSMLRTPIVEHFGSSDHLDKTLSSALKELISQEIGSGAMTAAQLRQVLIMVFRRSAASIEVWGERFSFLADRAIARAFTTMVARLDEEHSIDSLAKAAGLSRSAFISRFKHAFGQTPISVLRDLRMRRAKALLKNSNLSLEDVAEKVGYSTRTSFLRAFKKSYGAYPIRR
jgi:AraC family transcriptional regulator, activator of mtrCDE